MEKVLLWIIFAILCVLMLSFIVVRLKRKKSIGVKKNQYSEKPMENISVGNCSITTPDQDYNKSKNSGYYSHNS